ncbi:alpha/beta hydrolase [Shewanella sp.]|uniref:alpha/beta fold hydrolase n=1 Tax=Shewanella sp. TaxID=50422 RepID=UPI001EC4E22F|nr:alpha/beta hydrolase [Shewanella sp.]NRB22595.1 alpha/beta hydrolase [Shewanella sp.]
MKKVVVIFGCLLPFFAVSAAQTAKVGEFEIEYEISGSGKHTVLLEAGGTAGLSDWDPVFDKIAKFTKVIRYSRVGNGNSTQIQRHFSSDDYAKHVSDFLNVIDVQEPVLYLAHSYGAYIARTFSVSYPEQINAMMLIEPSSEHDVDIIRAIDLKKGNQEIAQIKKDDLSNGMSNQYLDFWSKRPLPDYPEIRDIPVTVIASVKKYKEPELLFFTDEARYEWGQLHKEWAESFPQGQVILTDKSYHYVQIDEPELVITELRKLLQRVN